MRLHSALVLFSLSVSTVAAQPVTNPETALTLRLAESAAEFVVEASRGANLSTVDIAVTVVCLLEAVEPLPMEVREQMAAAPDFEDALDLAVTFAENAGGELAATLEPTLGGCL
jgi:hypothetical protein